MSNYDAVSTDALHEQVERKRYDIAKLESRIEDARKGISELRIEIAHRTYGFEAGDRLRWLSNSKNCVFERFVDRQYCEGADVWAQIRLIRLDGMLYTGTKDVNPTMLRRVKG